MANKRSFTPEGGAAAGDPVVPSLRQGRGFLEQGGEALDVC